MKTLLNNFPFLFCFRPIERLQRIMHKALRKSSATSDEESVVAAPPVHHHQHQNEDENTDTEQHESLPHDQEEEDNKINTQKQSTTVGISGEKKRDLFPDLIKKLRESAAKKTNKADENNTPVIVDALPKQKPPTPEAIPNDDERVVRERRRSLLRKGLKPAVESDTEPKIEVIDEKSGHSKEEPRPDRKTKPKMTKPKPVSVFTFDEHDLRKTSTAPATLVSQGTADGDKDRSPSPIYATVNKVRKSPDSGDESIKGKFNSFFTIVREAVHARRQSLIVDQMDADIPPSPPLPSISDEESVTKRNVQARPVRAPISKRDSDCSIWSDNIPVITISKTESDECILEEDKKPSPTSSDAEQPPAKDEEDAP